MTRSVRIALFVPALLGFAALLVWALVGLPDFGNYIGRESCICCPGLYGVSDHRGSNSQAVDFERVEIYLIFTVKIGNPVKSNT